MAKVLRDLFVPQAVSVASEDCESIYESPLLASNEAILGSESQPIIVKSFAQLSQIAHSDQFAEQPDIEKLVRSVDHGKYVKEDKSAFFNEVLKKLVIATTVGQYAQRFETWGHPLACILVVSSSNNNPMSALTQLYQRSYTDCPQFMSADFLRCVLYVDVTESNKESIHERSGEDFETIFSQFGPYCYKISGFNSLQSGIETIAIESIYPYMQNLIKSWQLTGTSKKNSFGFGKLSKKSVNTGPPKPEVNLFAEVCREMQPHVASIPAKKRGWDIDMQVRRLADVAFMSQDYKLANAAYESLRKPFNAEQKWAQLGGVSEMAAITSTVLGHSLNDITQSVDSALYTYTSRIHSTAHALRCTSVVAACSIEFGNQSSAADLLSSTLAEIDPTLESGDMPAESAASMEEISSAYEKRGWHRKVQLWDKSAASEWSRVPGIEG